MAIASDGSVFVSDGYENSRVVHFDKNGKFIKTWGKRGKGEGQFHLVHAIGIDSKDRLYVADRSNARVQVFTSGGKFLAQWTDIIIPWGIWVTAKDEIWVCGSTRLPLSPPQDQVFIKFSPEGKVLSRVPVPMGKPGKTKPGEFDWVHGMAVDSNGNIYGGDIKGERVQKFKPGK